MQKKFIYNIPAYNSRLNEPGLFLNVVATKNVKGILLEVEQTHLYLLASIKNWGLMYNEIEGLAAEMFAEDKITEKVTA